MHRWICVVSLLFLPVLSGCSRTDFGPMGNVSGKLTMDGRPLAEGTQLLFMNMDAGHAAFGSTDAEGNYALQWQREGVRREELPIGIYKVLIQPPARGADPEEMSADEMLAGEDVAPAEPSFPKVYQTHATSGLEYEVAEGENTVDIDLDSRA